MRVTFRTDAHAAITMYGDVAKLMLKKMGHSGTIPGAILAEDIPAALSRLISTIDQDKEATTETKKDAWDDQSVSLKSRSTPLIELLKAAAENECSVSWEEARPTEPGFTI